MTDPLRGRAAVFLLRMGLLAGLLSIIAGIVGMHVMAGGHSMHAAPVVSEQAVHHAASPAAPSCTSTGTCTGMSALHAVCIPAPGHNTLTAPVPGVAPYASAATAGSGALVSGNSHRPGSPSPGDLCISRT
ncbi:hypothetical protein AB0O52_04980 [Arthrobacter sp. NPDC080073]|uniref:hypothetical protein n=1 Tax=Arthrobacter sp. NPDC080073 TaxID=3155919 RepID=UPI00342C4292